jgi:organic hydroperoxide reductase OsmC/OhrA
MRLLTPRSSRQGASPATHHLYPGDNPEPVGQQAAQSVSAAWSWLRLFSSEQRTRWNPAELLIAALSACHQLWYLHLCADAGIVVVAYSDDASGVEIGQADGAGQFESVTLRPHAKLAVGSDENIARRLHDAAAEKCFIARSVSFKVEHKPTFEIASA